jgi:alkylation response protein AidB-like acyl-CoA dehydrogenase
MDLTFSAEHEALREMTRKFLAERMPVLKARELMETPEGYSREVWRQLAQQLGLQGLIIPEHHGGSGADYVALTVVLEEMGRNLFAGPYFATVALAANAILASGDSVAMDDYLPGIAAGDLSGTLAVTEDNGSWELGDVQCRAVKSGRDYVIDGHKAFVLDGHVAGLVLVVARTEEGLSLLSVEGDADGLARHPLVTIDMTRRYARLVFNGTPARLIGTDGQARAALVKTLQLAAVALAAEQVGGAQACLETSVQYAKDRVQFGRPIGSFQAVKHRCADMLVAVESAKSAAYYAARAAAADSAELPIVASLAKAFCSEAYFQVAADNIQVHGGMGFTWEHDAHLYFKRAKSSELMFGDAPYHRELLVRNLGL